MEECIFCHYPLPPAWNCANHIDHQIQYYSCQPGAEMMIIYNKIKKNKFFINYGNQRVAIIRTDQKFLESINDYFDCKIAHIKDINQLCDIIIRTHKLQVFT